MSGRPPAHPPGDAAAAVKAAIGHHRAGRPAAAKGALRRALAIDPDDGAARHLMGLLVLEDGRADEAAAHLARAVAVSPADPARHRDLAMALRAAGRGAEAEQALQTALDLGGDDFRVHFELAGHRHRREDPEGAEAGYRRTLALSPDHIGATSGLGAVLELQGRMIEAEAMYRRVLDQGVSTPDAWFNLGNALRAQHRIDAAVDAYRQAIALDPDFAVAHVHLAFALLLAGDYDAGWAEYEWRKRVPEFPTPAGRFPRPPWDGAPVAGGTLLIHAEQGFGDTLQFARFTRAAAERGARVVVECQAALRRLMETAPAVVEAVAAGDPLPDFDHHVPLLGLPRILGTTLDTVPAEVPYLHADEAETAHWRRRLAGDRGRRLGLVWRSSARQMTSPYKSCPLSALAPLFEVPGLRFFSLQPELPAADRPLPEGVVDLGGELTDFAATAAVIGALDLVVTVDTAVAHLAGALGAPVWLLLSTASDWRWLTGRDDSPWYPTMRLLRQTREGDWSEPVARVVHALEGADG